MAGGKDVTVRAQALDGTWQTIGGDRARGLYPENVVLEADPWGSSRAAFNLRRDPTAFWPELGAFTPVEFEVGSSLVWSGRIKETPSQVAQRVMNVQCEGWQYHLDDDLYQRTYVHTNLGEWQDARSNLATPLGTASGSFPAVAQVSTGSGISIVWPQSQTFPAGGRAGVILDLGPGNTAAKFNITTENPTGTGNYQLLVRAYDTLFSGGESYAGPSGYPVPSGITTGAAVTLTTPRRYLVITSEDAGAGTHNPAADYVLKIHGMTVYASSSYEGGGVSALTASTVVTDALSRCTMLLSSDTSGVQTTSFAIPSYAPGTQTPRQAWAAVDSYHDWLKQIDVNRRAVYQAKPSRPIFEVGAWSAVDDDDNGSSGDEIFNRVAVTAQTPDGSSLSKRAAQTATTFDYAAAVQPSNPSFDASLTGWTGDAISRSTAVFDSTPASMLLTSAVLPGAFAKTSSWVGSWEEGVQYKLRMRIRREYAGAFLFTIEVRLGSTNALTDTVLMSGLPVGQFATYESLAFTIPGNVTPDLVLTVPSGGAPATGTSVLYVDTLQFIVSKPTLVDRRGFRKTMQLPVSSTLPTDGVAASQIGTIWLSDHKTTPFRGSLNLVGDQSLRSITNGADVGLEQLLVNTGQLVRFSDRSDPDTGGHGRDGRVAAVSYTPASNSASVTIDNSRTSFDALLSRLAIIQGG